MQLIGQESNKILIDKWITPPNFIIIQGERHSGKTYMVTYICDKFNLFYKQVNISIKDIRNLLNVMTPNSKTLYHLKNFDKASLRAKNALLKVAEETPEGNYIVITGGQQLKTLEASGAIWDIPCPQQGFLPAAWCALSGTYKTI